MRNLIMAGRESLRSVGLLIVVAVGVCAQRLPDLTFSPGIISTIAGTGTVAYSGDNGPALSASFRDPSGLAIGTGNIYIADTENNVIRRIDMSDWIISTVAGTGDPNYAGDGGPAISAAFHSPLSVAIDMVGNLYVADTSNNVVRKIDVEGEITTVAGNRDGTIGPGSIDSVGDGSIATSAILWHPSSLALDREGNLYIADTYNNRVRRVDAATQVITTIAGNGVAGYSGDGADASAASLNLPFSLAVDPDGNVAVADSNNLIRWIVNSTHRIFTIAGGGTSPGNDSLGDGSLSMGASFLNPMGLAFDATGRTLFISDSFHSLIRKIDLKTGEVGVVAGIDPNRRAITISNTSPSASTSPLDTDINVPSGIILDANGNLYFVDSGNDVVRELSSSAGSLVIYGGMGKTSTQTVTVNNAGGPASALSVVLTGNSDFALSSNKCPVQLPASGTCQVTVSFSSQSEENASATLSIVDEEPNSSTPLVLGSVLIAGQTMGQSPNVCSYMVYSSNQILFSAEGNGKPISVITGDECDWTADSDASWMTVTGGASGTGNGTITYVAGPNLSGSARSGTLYVAGQSFSVMQLGATSDPTRPSTREVTGGEQRLHNR